VDGLGGHDEQDPRQVVVKRSWLAWSCTPVQSSNKLILETSKKKKAQQHRLGQSESMNGSLPLP
jgi:hypothetical protein